MKKKLIHYSSNNSGGSWWLDEKDWKALEDAGWVVKKAGYEFVYTNRMHTYDEKTGFPIFKKSEATWPGVPTDAYFMAHSLEEAIDSFERATGQDAYAEGCPCCGAPHYFSEEKSRC